MAAPNRAPTKKQIGLIHVAKARLGLSDDAYRDVLRQAAGVGSASELDVYGFEALMDAFARMGFESDSRKTSYGHRPGMASPAQVKLIRELWWEYTDGDGTETGLNHWLERFWHVSSMRFLTAGAAPKIITALKKMKAKKPKSPKIDH